MRRVSHRRAFGRMSRSRGCGPYGCAAETTAFPLNVWPMGGHLLQGDVPELTLPGLALRGDTSNKGGRRHVLTNSGPLRPPVRRTSASLRCSSSPNGNGRFRWERSRSEISELSPSGGSERYAACGDAFGRWGVSGGGIRNSPPDCVFGNFLRIQKVTLPEGIFYSTI